MVQAFVARRRPPLVEAVAAALEMGGYRVRSAPVASAEGQELLAEAVDRTLPPPLRSFAVNPRHALRRLGPGEDWASLLWLHGIPVAFEHLPPGVPRPLHPPSPSEFAALRVHVADLHVLSVDGGEERLRKLALSGWKRQRLMEAACRAVYLLGLHFAAVTLRVHPAGGWQVDRVEPFPQADHELASAYGEGVAALAAARREALETAPDPLLGADPEFLMATEQGKVLYASNYVKHRGTVGYDRQSRARRGAVFPLVEVRPEPSASPVALTENTERALAEAARLLPTRRTRWMAGSFPLGEYPTGGHVHLSGTPLTTPLLSALDNYLALPVMLLEDRRRSRQRRRRYGRLGDFRRKEHGGFEYRALPSWLVSKEAARAVLCLAKVVASEWPLLTASPLANLLSAKEFYQGRKANLRRCFPPLWRQLVATRTGRRYAGELAYIARAVAEGREWNDESDFKKAWWN